VKTAEELAREIRAIEEKIQSLEDISIRFSDLDNFVSANNNGSNTLSEIMKQINVVQSLINHLEIEIDKLEMRVSAIEHMGFRLRTSGR
jgi:prefoldin subunit 5